MDTKLKRMAKTALTFSFAITDLLNYHLNYTCWFAMVNRITWMWIW